jgi:hypothetical protein
MSSDGKILEQGNSALSRTHTQVLGVTVENPVENERAVATEELPTETNESGELIPVTVTGAQRLSAALQILKALEANEIVGDAASVDVTRTEDIILWYGTRYQVGLGDSTRLDYKIDCMNDVIWQMSEYDSGILDISFRQEDPVANMKEVITDLVSTNDSYTILLSHSPEFFEIYASRQADLVLTGHVHGGQFRLPFFGGVYAPGQGFFPKYDAGLFTDCNTNMIISRGLGNSIFPFRLNNNPEIVIISLQNS